ncbi:MAG: hypothetical protein HYR72_15020 [Deltaproteobacteria bacterium]|nr:hypothetical protein [Deltaproteobacteria bacterium]MBI3390918.1 hypothetical protein [Deltaproteobacteria bacterium]
MAKKVTKKVSKKKPTTARASKAPAKKKAGTAKYDQSGAPWWKKLV